jgi:hypothetical protein
VFKNIPGVGLTTGKNIQRNQAELCIGMRRAVALIEHHHRCEAWRRVVPELVADLGYHLCPRKFCGPSHCAEESPIVEADFLPYVSTIYEKVLAFVQLIRPPLRG